MKKHSVWRTTLPFRVSYNKYRNIIETGYDEKTTGQLLWAKSGFQKLNFLWGLAVRRNVGINCTHCWEMRGQLSKYWELSHYWEYTYLLDRNKINHDWKKFRDFWPLKIENVRAVSFDIWSVLGTKFKYV